MADWGMVSEDVGGLERLFFGYAPNKGVIEIKAGFTDYLRQWSAYAVA